MNREEIKELIEEKLNEITREYNIICINHKEDLNYINICTHQHNAMKRILEELMKDLDNYLKSNE